MLVKSIYVVNTAKRKPQIKHIKKGEKCFIISF